MNASDLPTTFAHKPVWPRAHVDGLSGAIRPVCGCDVRVDHRVPSKERARQIRQALEACEMHLLDAMGLQTFSSFVCITFDVGEDRIRVEAWKIGAVNLQAA